MLIYSGTKKQFDRDVKSGRIAPKIEHEFYLHGLNKESIGEFRAWENSLTQMQRILDDDRFSNDLHIFFQTRNFIVGYCQKMRVQGKNIKNREQT